MHALFDIYRVDVDGSAKWLDSVQSYSAALLKIELIAAEAPSDYAIVSRQTADRTVLSFGLRSSSSWKRRHVSPQNAKSPRFYWTKRVSRDKLWKL